MCKIMCRPQAVEAMLQVVAVADQGARLVSRTVAVETGPVLAAACGVVLATVVLV
jgi:hypothetical protein